VGALLREFPVLRAFHGSNSWPVSNSHAGCVKYIHRSSPFASINIVPRHPDAGVIISCMGLYERIPDYIRVLMFDNSATWAEF
jgi:hypothetical protein